MLVLLAKQLSKGGHKYAHERQGPCPQGTCLTVLSVHLLRDF